MNRFESITKPLKWFMALLLVAFVAGCGNGGDSPILGGGGSGIAPPKVTSTVPANNDIGVQINRRITATFSEVMDPATLISPATSFTVSETSPSIATVAGTVTYSGETAVFTPTVALLSSTPPTVYTATITTLAKNKAGVAMAVNYSWVFSTSSTPPPVVTPVLISETPASGASGVALNSTSTATFSVPMDPATLNSPATTFTVCAGLVSGCATPVAGTVLYVGNTATFTPTSALLPGTTYTSNVSTLATDLSVPPVPLSVVAGVSGTLPDPWSWTTAAATQPPLAINLRSAATFGIAAGAGLTSTGVTVVNGDVALYPLATCTDATGGPGASAQTCITVSQKYATTTGLTVNGTIYYAGDPFDNGGTANSVKNDLNIAWTQGMNKVDTLAGVLVGELGGPGPVGKTLVPGVYNEANLGFAANGVATFDAAGDANAIWIIKVGTIGGAGDFTDSGTLLLPTTIKLANGAQARNIWFVVGRDAVIGHGTTWNGNILAGRTATIKDGSTVLGRVLAGAQTSGAITLTGAASPSVTTITVP